MEEIIKVRTVPGEQYITKSHLNGIATAAKDHITTFIVVKQGLVITHKVLMIFIMVVYDTVREGKSRGAGTGRLTKKENPFTRSEKVLPFSVQQFNLDKR
jgi:hypothetical protein